MRYIISGGGTGGHIFPAVAIGKAIDKLDKSAEILFVGAENRMEMERVPAEGFKIIGLPVAGFNRKNPLKNIPVLIKLYHSLNKAKKIIREFNPDVVIGVGGYASGPILKAAQRKNIPTLIQEQNSYAGVTNKLLAKKAAKICVAYDGMERFFPADKIVKTGNPLRPVIPFSKQIKKEDALKDLGFDIKYPLVAVVGGSLGALTINKAVAATVSELMKCGASLLWQTGKRYFNDYKSISGEYPGDRIKVVPFIEKMELVYAAADIIISRAGACTISEIQAIGIPSILIPSPNVAEDHQRKNALALAESNAAIMIPDIDAEKSLKDILIPLLARKDKLKELSNNTSQMGIEGADIHIAQIAIQLAENRNNNER